MSDKNDLFPTPALQKAMREGQRRSVKVLEDPRDAAIRDMAEALRGAKETMSNVLYSEFGDNIKCMEGEQLHKSINNANDTLTKHAAQIKRAEGK